MSNDLIDHSKEEAANKKLEKKRERQLSDIRRVLQLPEGRRLFWRVLEKGGVFRDAFANENTNGTNYNLGRQSLSRDFLNDLLEAKPDALQQIQNEIAAELENEKVQNKID